MKILFLTPQLPYPPHQGTTIRNYNLIVNLASRHEVHLLSFVRSRDDEISRPICQRDYSARRRDISSDELARATPLRERCRNIEVVPAPKRSLLKRLIYTLFSPLPDMALRLPSAEFRAKLEAYLRRERFDVLQVEGIEMVQYGLGVRGYRSGEESPLSPICYPLTVFDDHNAEYLLQRRAFETDVRHPSRWPGALYSFIQWQKLRRYEAEACRRFDRVVAVSAADAAALSRLVPGLSVTVVPNGVDTEYYKPQGARDKEQGEDKALPLAPCPLPLVFTGKMDFRPNVDAVLWFCDEVLPLVQREIPTVHFYIVGRDPNRRVLSLGEKPEVTVTGYVEDVRPYIAQSAVYVVPLRIGGGTRLKVLEAMAMGKAIVSTSLGCEGIELTSRELVIADTAEEFAGQVIGLLRDEARRRELGQAARRLVEARYDWRFIVPKLESVYGSGRGGLMTD